MDQAKTYLHVGLQKTASTYLQEKVFPHMSGLAYVGRPYTQENYAFNSMQYADDSIYNSDVLAEELRLIRQDVGSTPLLISDELFSGFVHYGWVNRGVIARRLAEVVPEAEVILFLRAQTDFIDSLYNQLIKRGTYTGELDASFLYEHGRGFSYQRWKDGERGWDYQNRAFQPRHLLSTSHFLYSRLLSLYESLFSRVHVFLYEDLASDPGASLGRLEDILSAKITQDLDGQQEHVNAGLDDADLRLRLTQGRLSFLRPLAPRSKYLRRLLARPASLLLGGQSETERREYVTKSLRAAGIFEDNKRLDQSRGLGMQKYADKYFPDA